MQNIPNFSQSGKKLVKQNLEADEGGINLCTTELKWKPGQSPQQQNQKGVLRCVIKRWSNSKV